jgi:hypothetical protein
MATDLTRREIAEREVQRLNVDALVRVASRGGRYDGTANYERKVPTSEGWLELYSTSGAGTNSASVRWNRELVYECADHGRQLRTFRRGAWIEDVHRLARQQMDVEEADRLLRDVSRKQQESDAFTPLDDSR